MKPICLITPPSPFLMDERVFVSLGILKVAASLEAAGYHVDHLDLSGIENYEDAVQDYAARSDARNYGITATTPQLPAAVKIARAVYQASSDARTILGGPHVTLVTAAKKREDRLHIADGRANRAFYALGKHFDRLVAGDGEFAIREAVKDWAPPFIDADDPKSDLFMSNDDLNRTPFPARHLVDLPSYHYEIDGVDACSLIAQLGCPFACGFCGGRESPMLRRVRMRSTQSVVAEIVHLHKKYRYRGFMLYDDELNVNREMVPLMRAIRKAQDSLGVEFRLRGFIKAQLFTEEQAEAMFQAGFRWILAGFESGNPRILENINKKSTREQNTRCLEIAHKHGLKVKALMSIGHPGEREETVDDTRLWLLDAKPDDFDATIITTYPGTPYYDQAIPHPALTHVWTYTAKSGDRLHAQDVDFMHDQAYYKGTPGDYRSFVFTDFLSANDLVALRDEMEMEVRAKLDIPFQHAAPAIRFEHSMGQGLPGTILRETHELVGKCQHRELVSHDPTR
jgi:anaerobic magnesium-protoporphyrin IX monomethyl ester cyclase